jgi:ADP-ribose pyrophosphatase
VHLFCATELEPVPDHEPDPGERIELVRWPLSELDDAIAACEDSKSLIGMLLLRESLD